MSTVLPEPEPAKITVWAPQVFERHGHGSIRAFRKADGNGILVGRPGHRSDLR